MNRSVLLILSAAFVASSAIACSASSSEDAASSDNALTGSLANAKACAVRDAYAAAQLSAFKTAAKAELPGGDLILGGLSKFDVPNVGTVFVSDDGTKMSFFGSDGVLLARGTPAGDDITWTLGNSAPLSCNTQQQPDQPPPQNEAGAPTQASCLATEPIDATQFGYVPPAPAAAGKCTLQEVAAISSFYRDHAADENLTSTWATSVSAGCGSCAFGTVEAATWAPILLSSDGQIDVDRGGCIGTVSKSADCGRAYQQFQDCTLQACLTKCQTQEEYNACRSDQAVLTTACKDALATLTTTCGQDKIGEYETACQGTTYTFEGPLKVMCVNGQ